MKKLIYLLITLVLCVSCTKNEIKLDRYSNISIDSGFNTFVELIGYTQEKETFDNYFQITEERFKYFNQLFDIYHSYQGLNNLYTVNSNAGIKPIEVDQNIIDLLKIAKDFYDYSSGEFDITYGAVLKIWHNYREEGLALIEDGKLSEVKVPSTSELEQAKACTGWQYIEIDDDNNTVYINNPCVSLDVGGIAKGYTAEVVAQELESEGLTLGVVNAGGNNRTIGTKQDGSPWSVQIQNPSGNITSTGLVKVKLPGSLSFVTSGDYQNFFVGPDGTYYHHIIDPKTLFPATNFHSVSIITKDSAIADALSTTLFTLNYEDGLNLVNKYNSENPDNQVNVVWITDASNNIDSENSTIKENYQIIWTKELNNYIEY